MMFASSVGFLFLCRMDRSLFTSSIFIRIYAITFYSIVTVCFSLASRLQYANKLTYLHY